MSCRDHDKALVTKLNSMPKKIEINQLSCASVVVEIVGLSGAGKTTLAELLPGYLAKANVHAIHSKTKPLGSFSLGVKAAGALLAAKDIIRLSPFFLRPFINGNPRLGLSGFRRLLKSFRHSFPRRVLQLALPYNTVIVQEPGWPMELLSHYLYSKGPLTAAEAQQFLMAAPPTEYLVILIAEPRVSISRMKRRNRGIPKGLRHLGENELQHYLERGNSTSAVLSIASSALGIKTLKLDVSNLDADEVATCVLEFILAAKDGRRNRNE